MGSKNLCPLTGSLDFRKDRSRGELQDDVVFLSNKGIFFNQSIQPYPTNGFLKVYWITNVGFRI